MLAPLPPVWSTPGASSGDGAGSQVYGIGDYDGDGYDDIFISSEVAGTFFLLGGT